ncbi:MAG TPA: 3-phosphoshikimate 1-carboxyvinyltransferase [Pseudobdellovibrionaceae bacterium]|nr:3-phosphoshikimate 1-carboxyvinyltransferase [Pseudobdellovibrionaceae bacterium]
MFQYKGEISASKSLMNRALIVQSYEPKIELFGSSDCSDVLYMKQALKEISNKNIMDAGEGGTTFRFLVLRASRLNQKTTIQAHPKLLSRPQQELIQIANQLGVLIEIKNNSFVIQSSGWKPPKEELVVERGVSSQFLSGVMLNTWDLNFPLKIHWKGERRSEGYLRMTLEMLRHMGLIYIEKGEKIIVEPYQKPKIQAYRVESDVSSAFSVAAAGALFGRVELLNFPFKSLQPDIEFIKILADMGVNLFQKETSLVVEKAVNLKSIDVNLQNCPDLFPVLSVLCAQADGVSRLYGAPHLVHKESNRIELVSQLLRSVGVQHQCHFDGMTIYGEKKLRNINSEIYFNPAQDHRMAMAAGLFRLSGLPLNIQTPEVVDKSFPEFWKILGLSL